MNIYEPVVSEFEGQIIKSDADYTNDEGTWIKNRCMTTALRSQTLSEEAEFKLFDPSTIVLQADDSKMMGTIMFGAQTAKQFQNNGQYQDNPKLECKRKTHKSVKFQIEEDRVIEAYVTHWKELKKQDRVQQGQEIEKQNRNLSKYAVFIGEGYIFSS